MDAGGDAATPGPPNAISVMSADDEWNLRGWSRRIDSSIWGIGKIYYLKSSGYTYPITKQIILDGRKNKVLNNKINLKIPITLLHGSKDKVVPLSFSKKVLNVCKKSKKKLVIIKNGDHSLSSPQWLKILKSELKLIIN